MEKADVLERTAQSILNGKVENARKIISEEYPFQKITVSGRNYTDKEKMEQFKKDGFIDRYSGDRLVNPGLLKVLSNYMPDIFPYQAHGKMDECHISYWELLPTIDHKVPVALGGSDEAENWVTTSMLHNSIKSNWTLEQLHWKLYDPGDYAKWDGLTSLFAKIVNANPALQDDLYIRKWYKLI